MSHNVALISPYWRIPEWFQMLNTAQLDLLHAFHNDICKWTKKINLISSGTLQHSDRVHFADSIMGAELIFKALPNSSFIDLGSGNGFPAIVFSILNLDIDIECVDSDERKIAFIRQFSLRQGLKNLRTNCSRIESLPQSSISLGSARALGSTDAILAMCASKFLSGGSLFLFKGPDWQREVSMLSKLNCSTWNISLHGAYQLPQISTDGVEERVILRAVRI